MWEYLANLDWPFLGRWFGSQFTISAAAFYIMKLWRVIP